MANELTISMSMTFRKGAVQLPAFGFSGLQFDVTGTKYVRNIQNIGLTEEAIDLGEITTPRYGLFRNLDTTNPIYIRRATGQGNMVKLRPGGVACFELEATAPYAIATTAACNLEYMIVEA